MFEKEIVKEKIIDGIETKLTYKGSIIGEKKLVSKWESYDDKEVYTTYSRCRDNLNPGWESVPDGTITHYIEYKYFDKGTNKERLLQHGIEKLYSMSNLRKCGKDYPDKNVLFLQFKGFFKEDRIDEEFCQYYPNNQIFKQYYYENGYLHGECKQFFPNGEKIIICNYDYGKPIGLFKEFYDKGVKFEGKFVDGIPVGEHNHYDYSGYLVKKYSFTNGYNDFNRKLYYEDSNNIKSFESFIDGEPTLRYREYHNPTFVGPTLFNWGGVDLHYNEFSHGTLHGYCKYYSRGGEILQEGEYERDKKVGQWLVNEDLKNDEDED